MAFSGLLHLLRALHLSSELLQFSQQALVAETKYLHLIGVVVYGFHSAPGRSAIYVTLLVLHTWGKGVTPACVPS